MHEIDAPPFRDIGDFTPLVTAEQGFPAYERLALEAKQHLWLSFRIFDPTTRLRHATEYGDTWLDLLRHRLQDGITVRILLSDFDPIVAPDLHEASARAASALTKLEEAGDLETMIIRHEARVGKGVRFGLWLPAAVALRRQRDELNGMEIEARSDAFAHRPGLWRYLRQRKDGKIVWRGFQLPRLYPATFHQKIVLADDREAILGGLDIDERRFDTWEHDQEAHETWQDLSVSVTGPVVTDISAHIAACWNRNRLGMMALRQEQTRFAPSNGCYLTSRFTPLETPAAPTHPAASKGVRLLRTLSVRKRGLGLRFSPMTTIKEIEKAHIAAIHAARKSIYIETQYFRSLAIAQALEDTAKKNPDVNLVMILPAAPEEIAFEDQLRLSERMGEHLQVKCVDKVLKAFGPRAALLCPIRKAPMQSDKRDQLYGSGIIYVHSKILIIDDARCIVGSANLNGRSMRWDTEAAVECTDAEKVRGVRQLVFKHWLSEQPPERFFDLEGIAKTWADLAEENARKEPSQREGFLVPYDPTPARKIGMPLAGVPDELV